MIPIWVWARRELLRHRRATLALVLLIGVSGAVVFTTTAGARRSASAFDRFLEASNTADAQLQYYSNDVELHADVLEALRADPAVALASQFFITVAFSEQSEYDLGVFSGPDRALFGDIDIPRLLEGRQPDPTDPHEILINPFTQENLGVEVGDVVTIGTFSAEQFGAEDLFEEPAGPEIDLEVVGVSVTAYDLADPEAPGLYGTPAFHERYWGDVGGFGPTIQIAAANDGDLDAAIDRVVSDFALQDVYVSFSSYQAEKVEDGTRVLVVGLSVFAGVAGLAALVAIAQALHRRMAETGDDHAALRSIGLKRSECMGAVLLSVLPVIVAGTLLAALLAILASPLMPIGQARRAEPSPGVDVDLAALGIGSLLMVIVLSTAALVGAVRTTRAGLAPAARRSRRPAASLLASGRFAPSSQLGVSMALDPGHGRTSVPVRSAIAGAAIGVAGVIGAMTFGAGLDSLVENPTNSGWNWTIAPDVRSDEETDQPVTEHLRAVGGVEEIGVIYNAQVEAAGERMTGVSMQAEMGTPEFTVVRGRMPAGPREVALGPKTAERLGLGIGDPIAIGSPDAPGGTLEGVVVGEVLLPTFDENAFNQGIALAPDTLRAVAQSDGFDQVVVGLGDGVDEEEAADRVRAVDPEGVSTYSFSSLPPDVAHLDEVRFLPRVLGVFLGLLAVAAVGHALATSVRRRRHDLGIVRSLGFVARDVLRTLTTQSWTLVAFGLGFGIPLGIALGRTSWGLVADQLGVRPSAAISPFVVAVVVLLAGVLAAVLSVPPGISAARQRAVDTLRVE